MCKFIKFIIRIIKCIFSSAKNLTAEAATNEQWIELYCNLTIGMRQMVTMQNANSPFLVNFSAAKYNVSQNFGSYPKIVGFFNTTGGIKGLNNLPTFIRDLNILMDFIYKNSPVALDPKGCIPEMQPGLPKKVYLIPILFNDMIGQATKDRSFYTSGVSLLDNYKASEAYATKYLSDDPTVMNFFKGKPSFPNEWFALGHSVQALILYLTR